MLIYSEHHSPLFTMNWNLFKMFEHNFPFLHYFGGLFELKDTILYKTNEKTLLVCTDWTFGQLVSFHIKSFFLILEEGYFYCGIIIFLKCLKNYTPSKISIHLQSTQFHKCCRQFHSLYKLQRCLFNAYFNGAFLWSTVSNNCANSHYSKSTKTSSLLVRKTYSTKNSFSMSII